MKRLFDTEAGLGWEVSTDTAFHFADRTWGVVGPCRVTGMWPGSKVVSGVFTKEGKPWVRDGSQKNPRATGPSGMTQGYDSSAYAQYANSTSYSDALNVGMPERWPIDLEPGDTIVSTISVSQPDQRPQLYRAGILTCVEAPLPSFRHLRSEHYGHPPVEAIAFSKIPRVSFPTPADLDLDTVLSWVQGYWFRQATGWIGKYLHPQGAMPYYGREISDRTGQAILWTMLAGQHSEAQRRLVAGYCVQRGLDFVGFALDAGSKYARDFYGPNAGHCNGFVWPALFAGLLLENDALLEAASGKTGILWSERAQTFVVEETSPGVFNQDYGGYLPIEVGMPDWGEGHATQPQNDDWRWTTAEPLRPGQKTNVSAKSANYRLCCSHTTQHAQIAGIEAMKAKAAFAHDPYFAYHKRFLAENKRRGITDWRNAWTKWTLEALYRVAPEYLPT